jgi:hypothetical protein
LRSYCSSLAAKRSQIIADTRMVTAMNNGIVVVNTDIINMVTIFIYSI